MRRRIYQVSAMTLALWESPLGDLINDLIEEFVVEDRHGIVEVRGVTP